MSVLRPSRVAEEIKRGFDFYSQRDKGPESRIYYSNRGGGNK